MMAEFKRKCFRPDNQAKENHYTDKKFPLHKNYNEFSVCTFELFLENAKYLLDYVCRSWNNSPNFTSFPPKHLIN